ncbi:uncharacterized protein BJ212DRAFT_1577120 [Suillus subaureus]|uniref:F-box domain-containing protein n=1 Tax=Suillus subaureus TaxID=48587 RepID=A0A9P7EAY5_9AGAM|nr:uncharacterized protein BJ212DRAFT_1577120 [Suillus subaureus]KAG1816485.1 hypothetical protein BJ212DRAFT_1577120 [Suillus subaureus]
MSDALLNINQMPDLETPYSKASLPNTTYSNAQLEYRTIGAIITEREQQLDATLHEISDLETVMDSIQNLRQQLIGKKENIIKSINLHKGFISALWRLPTEVLSQIFHHCLPEIQEFNRLNKPSVSEAPMLLTAVCRRWREVAVAMLSLWCRLAVSIDREGQWKRQIFCYQSWLKRSRGCPLSIELMSYNCAYDWTKILHFLHPHVNQIVSLCIHVPFEEDQAEYILNILSPTLQELTIFAMETTDIFVQSISRLSVLRSLHILGLSFNIELLSRFNSVWARLTNVTINTDESDTVLHLLRLAPNISSVHMIVFITDETMDLELFAHTTLQSLRITCETDYRSTRRLSKLFDALSFPSLRIFKVSGEPPWPHEKFKAFLTRSKCPLETLILGTDVKTTHEQRAEYVALIPSLEVFVLQREI